MKNYQKLDDYDLINYLFTEGGRLSRIVVDEFLRRGQRIITRLSDVVSEKYNWSQPNENDDWWSVIHAVYILGTIGTPDTVVPLVRALRLADAYDNEYVIDELPSIFGKIGMPALDYLKRLAEDKTSGNQSRIVAILGLAAITINNTKAGDKAFPCIYSIFQDEEEEQDVKDCAAHVLIDFLRIEYKDALLAFARENQKLEEEFRGMSFFKVDEIEDAFAKNEKNLSHYMHDWMSFYDEDQIEQRQECWEEDPTGMTEEDEYDEEDYFDENILRPFVKEVQEIGRNEPCPCGSGKKYKKCCLGKDKISYGK